MAPATDIFRVVCSMTALHYAAYENSAEAVRGLVAAGADMEAVEGNKWVRLSPAMLACQNSATDAVRALVELGCSRAYLLQNSSCANAQTMNYLLQLPDPDDRTAKELMRDEPQLIEVHQWLPEWLARIGDCKVIEHPLSNFLG